MFAEPPAHGWPLPLGVFVLSALWTGGCTPTTKADTSETADHTGEPGPEDTDSGGDPETATAGSCTMVDLGWEVAACADLASPAAARAICQSLGTGWDLLSIRSYAEAGAVTDLVLDELVDAGGAPFATIGLTDEAEEGVFRWDDGSELTATRWGPDEPNDTDGDEDCVMLRADAPFAGDWNDIPCTLPPTDRKPFLCNRR